jgi:hypothetical protein
MEEQDGNLKLIYGVLIEVEIIIILENNGRGKSR